MNSIVGTMPGAGVKEMCAVRCTVRAIDYC